MSKALGIIYRAIATHLTRKAGYTKTTAQTGAVTLIQCFGGRNDCNWPTPAKRNNQGGGAGVGQ